MANFNDDPFGDIPKKAASHEIGQNLDALSVHELEERIEILKSEIIRLEQKKHAKQVSKSAADSFFKS